jgi:hypothetical protein
MMAAAASNTGIQNVGTNAGRLTDCETNYLNLLMYLGGIGGGASLQRTRLLPGEFPDLQGIIREFSLESAFLAISASGKSLQSLRFSREFPMQENREF